jgi:hypothetical protein
LHFLPPPEPSVPLYVMVQSFLLWVFSSSRGRSLIVLCDSVLPIFIIFIIY